MIGEFYLRDVFDATESKSWDNITWENSSSQASLNSINISVRSCDDAACDTEPWNESFTNSPGILNVDNNQYFQYKVEMLTTDTSGSPQLYNVSVGYSSTSDTTAPTINPVFSPTNLIYSTSTIFFNATADESIDTWIVNWNGTNTTLASINSSLEVEDGNHNLLFYGNDSSGNTGENNTIYFTVDTAAPVIALPFHTNGTFKKNTDNLILNISITDALSGSTGSACFIDLNGTNQTIFASSGWCNTTMGNLTNLADGNQTIKIYANDSAGNIGLNDSYVVQVDTTNPTASIGENPIAYYNSSSTSVVFNMSCSDNMGPISSGILYGNWTTGWHANYTDNTLLNNTSVNRTVEGLIEGIYVWGVYCNDSANNLDWGVNRTVSVVTPDTTAPTINPVFSPTNLIYSTSTIFFNATADESIDTWIVNWNGTNTTLASINSSLEVEDGNHNLLFYGNDSSGNTGENNTIYFMVDTAVPVVTLVSPLNNSGSTSGNVTFIYNVTDASSITNCSLILNETTNETDTSITKDISQEFTLNNLIIGQHNWSVNCTDSISASNEGESISNYVNVLTFNNFSGETTNLSGVDLSDVESFTIDDATSGKIVFSNNVDIVNLTNLDSYVNISNNRIELDSSNLTNLNTSARLTLRDLSFSDPRPLIDGVVCSSTICTEVSYFANTFVFDVNHFTIYSAGETPVTTTPAVSSGGSGGGSVAITPNFILNVDEIEEKVSLGEVKFDSFTIKNNNSVSRTYKIKVESLEGIVSLDAENITIEPGQTGNMGFRIASIEEVGTYIGKIIVSSGSTSKEILISIDVNKEKTIFDIVLTIPPSMKTIVIDQDLQFMVNLLQIGLEQNMDVTLNYMVSDFDGNVFLTESETIAVNGEKLLDKSLGTLEIPEGKYVLSIELIYPNDIAVTSSHFTIIGDRVYTKIMIAVGIVFIGFIIAIILFIIRRAHKGSKRIHKHKKSNKRKHKIKIKKRRFFKRKPKVRKVKIIRKVKVKKKKPLGIQFK